MWPQMTSMTLNAFFLSHVMTYLMKGFYFSIRPFNVLDKFEVIWPHHDWKRDLRWPPWPQQWLLRITCQVTYQMKGNDFSIRPFNVFDKLEDIWPHHDQKCDLRWPPWPKPWLFLFPMSCDISNGHGLMEVIWSHIFGHGEVKLPPICLKHWKVEYWSHYFSFDRLLDMCYAKVIVWSWRSSEVRFRSWWGHFGYVKWPPICLKHWKVEYWSHNLSFDMSHDMGYEKVIFVVMEVIWGHSFGHGEVKWPPICLKHWNVEYWSHHL